MKKTRAVEEFCGGFRAMAPLIVAVMPIGLVFGAIAATKGLSSLETFLMSALVFAGGSQFVALDIWAHPASWAALGFSALLVNIRHLLMSASIGTKMPAFSGPAKYAAMLLLADEIWAMAEVRAGETRLTPAWYAGLALHGRSPGGRDAAHAGLVCRSCATLLSGLGHGRTCRLACRCVPRGPEGARPRFRLSGGLHRPAHWLLEGTRNGCGSRRERSGGGARAPVPPRSLVHRRRRGRGRHCGAFHRGTPGGLRVTLDPHTLLAIVTMAAATILTRLGGLVLIRFVTIGPKQKRALEAIPPAVLMAVIAPTALVTGPAETLAALATALVAMRLPLLAAVATGVMVVALARMFGA
ncbi:hypothetical protein BMJ34_07100 [Sinorhizobium medicae]|nr:hypothetical protein BMJ34_07100 [Sinorhizobium medicae]